MNKKVFCSFYLICEEVRERDSIQETKLGRGIEIRKKNITFYYVAISQSSCVILLNI